MVAIPVSLDKAVTALFQPVADPGVLKLLKTVLGNVIREPQELKFRSLSTPKVITKLAAINLAPLYILRHAGFVSGEAYYVLSPEASIEPVKTALAAVASREFGVEVGPEGVDGGQREGKTPSTSSFAGKTAPVEISHAEAAEELQRHLDAEADFKRRKEERLRIQREKQEAEEALKQVETEMKVEQAQIEDLQQEKALAESEIKKLESEASPSLQCEHCSLVNEEGATDCSACGLPLNLHSEVARVHLPPEATEGELDDEMMAIVQNLQKKETEPGGVKAEGEDGKKLSEMTREEKMAWLEQAKMQNKKRKEAASFAKDKESEKNRVALAKAALELQERQEQYAVNAALAAKKREEKERKIARDRIREKIAEHKREKMADQAAEAREKERLEGLKKPDS